MREDKEAARPDLADSGAGIIKVESPGSDYYPPESVPGSISTDGDEAPGTVTGSSRDSERYQETREQVELGFSYVVGNTR